MPLSRYKNEIALGANVLMDATEKIREAQADDGKVDAAEAVSIFLSALLSALLGAVAAGK